MQARRVGLVLARVSRMLGEEPYYHEFMEGLERVLTPAGFSVLLKVVTDRAAEIATYELWCAQLRVDAVILVDLGPNDDRVDLVARLGLPAVVIGDPSTAPDLPTVWTNDAGFSREVVAFLADTGHEVIGHVSGPAAFAHTQIRRGGFDAEAGARSLRLFTVEGDYSSESGFAATTGLLNGDVRPTAVVFDNDLMALGGLEAIAARGLAVPRDVSVVAWDDSPLCQLAVPVLSAMSHDVGRIGELAAHAVLDAMEGKGPGTYEAPPAHIVVRDSTR